MEMQLQRNPDDGKFIMNFKRFLSLICSAFMLFGAAKSQYVPYEDEAFRYRIDIPSDWKRSSSRILKKSISSASIREAIRYYNIGNKARR